MLHDRLREATTAQLAVKIATVKVPKRVEHETEELVLKRGFVSVGYKFFGF